MRPATLHTLLIDLPIALVLFGPLLFVAATVGKDSNRALTVPAVMLSVLGASSLFAFYFDTYTAAHAIKYGDVTQEVLWHLHELRHITARTFIAMGLLFAGALLLSRLMVHMLSKTALRVYSIILGVVYALSCVWLLVVAHQGANLADHLASHAQAITTWVDSLVGNQYS